MRLLPILTALLLAACAGPLPEPAGRRVEASFVESGFAGVMSETTYEVDARRLRATVRGAGEGSPTVRIVELSDADLREVDRLVADAIAQGDLGSGCSDSPYATLRVTAASGAVHQARVDYCGPQPPASSALASLLDYLGHR